MYITSRTYMAKYFPVVATCLHLDVKTKTKRVYGNLSKYLKWQHLSRVGSFRLFCIVVLHAPWHWREACLYPNRLLINTCITCRYSDHFQTQREGLPKRPKVWLNFGPNWPDGSEITNKIQLPEKWEWPVDKVSGRQSVRGAKCPGGKVSGGQSVRGAKCPGGKVSGGQSVLATKCPMGKVSGVTVYKSSCSYLSPGGEISPDISLLAMYPGTIFRQ